MSAAECCCYPLRGYRLLPMATLNEATAQAVRAGLRRRGISQSAAGAALGMSQPAINRRLAGAVPWNLDELERLAEQLGIDVRELLQPRSLQPLGATA